MATKLNYLNMEYPVDPGIPVEDMLPLFNIDPNAVTIEYQGDTVYVLEKSGTKGAFLLGEYYSVKSSVLDGFTYDSNDLTVTLKEGDSYVYHDVPSFVVEGLLASGSKGGFFVKYIKDHHDFDKLHEDEDEDEDVEDEVPAKKKAIKRVNGKVMLVDVEDEDVEDEVPAKKKAIKRVNGKVMLVEEEDKTDTKAQSLAEMLETMTPGELALLKALLK